jgi:hypothetical protein
MGVGRDRSRATLESRSFGQLAQGRATDFCAQPARRLSARSSWSGPGLDRLLVDTVRQTFVRHERE